MWKSNAFPSWLLKRSHLVSAFGEDISFLDHILSSSNCIRFPGDLPTSWPSSSVMELIRLKWWGSFHFHLIDFSSLLSASRFLRPHPHSSTSCLFPRKFPMLSSCFLDAGDFDTRSMTRMAEHWGDSKWWWLLDNWVLTSLPLAAFSFICKHQLFKRAKHFLHLIWPAELLWWKLPVSFWWQRTWKLASERIQDSGLQEELRNLGSVSNPMMV